MLRLLLGCFLLLVPLVASAAGLAPRKASDVVVINQTGATCPVSGYLLDNRTLPSGEYGTFTIPAGQVLIVTGVTWSAYLGTPGAPVVGVLSSQTPQTFVTHFASMAAFTSNGEMMKNDLTPPIVIEGGRSICFYVNAGQFNAATLHGFLAPDK